MAQAMVKVLTGHPQRQTTDGFDMATRDAFGEAHARHGNHTLQHTGEGDFGIIVDVTDGQRAGDVGGAIGVLAATVEHHQIAILQRAVGFLCHAVVHDCTVGAGTGDGVKADFQQGVGGAAELFQLGDNINFGERGFVLCIKPTQEIHHCGPIAQVRFRHAGNLGGVFARLGHHTRVLTVGDLCIALRHSSLHGNWRAAFVQPHCAGELREEWDKGVWRMHADSLPKVVPHVGEFLLRHKQINSCVGIQHGKPMCQRITGNIRAANVQKPCNAVGQGDDGSRLAMSIQIRR